MTSIATVNALGGVLAYSQGLCYAPSCRSLWEDYCYSGVIAVDATAERVRDTEALKR